MKRLAALFCLLTALSLAKVTEVTSANYNDFIKSPCVVVDVYAEWCGPCKRLAPMYDEVSGMYSQYAFGKINGEKESQLASKFGVRGYPTILFFKDGIVVDKIQGVPSKEQLKDKIQKIFGE